MKSIRQHERALAALARRGRLRALIPASGLDFTSNDYLGLAASAQLREAARDALARGVPVGAGGSRLLRGNHAEHEALEAEAAAFFGAEAALYFGGGFGANAALIATLPAHGDLIVHDALIHASAWEGMAQTKASCVSVPHNDVLAFEDAIRAWRAGGGRGRFWIAVETLYSMDGDTAPLADLVSLADRHDAMVLLDEAHASGVLGPDGRGLGAAFEGRENVVSLHTCGKALGASGALITCSASIRDFLINRARGFIYATAPSPVMAAVVRRALRIVRDEPWRREQLAARVAFAGAELARSCRFVASGSQIMPVIVGSDARAVALAGVMRAAGFDVRAIRPPTVPEGTARLRITLTLNTDVAGIAAMLATLARALGGGGVSAEGCLGPGRVEGIASRRRRDDGVNGDGAASGGARTGDLADGVHPSPQPSPQGERGQGGDSGQRLDDRVEWDRSAGGHALRGWGSRPTPPLEGLVPPDHPGTLSKTFPRFVVTGTGTGVGKTVFAAGLVGALDGAYWKPVQAGIEGGTDTERVSALSGLPGERFFAERYRLSMPASPHQAAEAEGVEIDAAGLELPACDRPLVIEGAGGVLVPLTREVLFADVFARWGLPVIVVAGTGLGTINHTLLSIEALRARDVPVFGVAFVGEANAESERIICERGGVRRLGRLGVVDPLTPDALRAAFAAGFDMAEFSV